MSNQYYVAVIEYNDGDTEQRNIVKQSRVVDTERQAEKLDAAMSINLDHDHYYTMIYCQEVSES